MTIDAPKTSHIPALKQLWQEAFGDDDAFLENFFSVAFSPNHCRCLFLSGQVAAALYWFDCSWKEEKVAYIYAVATDKAFRGRGLCSALMKDTHKHLFSQGYRGATLVPGNQGLFQLYEKLGYRSFCPLDTVTVEASGTAVALKSLSKEDFFHLRRTLLPQNGILQEGVIADFLATFTEFFAAENSILCLSREKNTVYFQEFLGDSRLLPGILTALQAEKGILRLPGETDSAMFFSLDTECPDYLGISLG